MIITKDMVFKLIIKNEGKQGICDHSTEKLSDITTNPNWKGSKIAGGLKYICNLCGQERHYLQLTERVKL